MAVDLKSLSITTPYGINPDYFHIMRLRLEAKAANRAAGFKVVPVPKLPNKYVPHIGAKQRAKGAK